MRVDRHRVRRRPRRNPSRAAAAAVGIAFAGLAASLLAVAAWPGAAPAIALVDGLAVGGGLGVSGAIPQYDDCYDEFWEATALTYVLGALALVVYLLRRERPSAFFVVEAAAGTVGYLMLLFISPLEWLAADLMLYAGTFTGWFVSGLFRPGAP